MKWGVWEEATGVGSTAMGAIVGEGSGCVSPLDVVAGPFCLSFSFLEPFGTSFDFLGPFGTSFGLSGSGWTQCTIASSGGKGTLTMFFSPSGEDLFCSHEATSHVEPQFLYLQVITTFFFLLLRGRRCLRSCDLPLSLRRQLIGCPFGSRRL